MSLESWKAEFYPVDACTVSEEDAVAHSLQKWRGLTPENLDKHNLILKNVKIREKSGKLKDKFFVIGAKTCALCHHYLAVEYDGNDSYEIRQCEECPIYKLLGRPCDDNDYAFVSPYYHFVAHNDPQPMIKVLKRLVKGT